MQEVSEILPNKWGKILDWGEFSLRQGEPSYALELTFVLLAWHVDIDSSANNKKTN